LSSGVVRASVVERSADRTPAFRPAALALFGVSAALALVLIALSLLLGRAWAPSPYLPVGLYLGGLGLLAATAGVYGWKSALAPARPAAPTRNVLSAAARPPAREEARPARRLHLALLHGGAEWRVPDASLRATDGNWLSWLGHEHRRLGPEASGFAFSGGYSVGRPGGLVPIPLRRSGWSSPEERPVRPVVATTTGGLGHSVWEVDESSLLPSATLMEAPSPVPGDAHKFTDEELDRLFPPYLDRRTRFLTEAPMRVGFASALPPTGANGLANSPAVAAAPGGGAPPSVDSGSNDEIEEVLEDVAVFPSAAPVRVSPRDEPFAVPSFWDARQPGDVDLVALEATNPVPPHLRLDFKSSLTNRGPDDGPSRAPSGAGKSVCASCSVVVVNLRLSGPCPKCLRPICTDCLREGLRRYGRGWCEDCAQDVRLGAG